MFQAAVAVHIFQLELVHVDQALGLWDGLLLSKHLTDLHEGLVFGLGDDNVDVDGHRHTNGGKHQVAVGPC